MTKQNDHTDNIHFLTESRIDRRRFIAIAGGAIAAVGAASRVGAAQDETFKVAFIYVGPVGDLGWSYAHDEGRKYLEANVAGVETAYSENVPEAGADAERVFTDYAQKGYKLIIGTSFGYMDAMVNVAKKFPDAQFIHMTGYKTAENLGTGFGKIEEPRYVSGLIAGKMSASGKLGYVAANPIPEVIRGINAFTLGVRQSNPAATVQVVWTNTWYDPQKERQAAEALLDAGCDVLAQHQDTAGPMQAAEAAGKYGVGYNADMASLAPKAVLTCPIWHWGLYYAQVVSEIQAGTYKAGAYWGSWQDGLVDLSPIAAFVPADVTASAEAEIAKFKSGEESIYTIFTGPLKDNEGADKVADGVAMSDADLLGITWLVEGVDGKVPS